MLKLRSFVVGFVGQVSTVLAKKSPKMEHFETRVSFVFVDIHQMTAGWTEVGLPTIYPIVPGISGIFAHLSLILCGSSGLMYVCFLRRTRNYWYDHRFGE
jgi:hypothetical protein